ncbi:hypothetical protein [Pseudopedobacter beijingensis]|uniref:Glycosyl hydrolase family 67 N-terminus n=1 Tax=Pseudopedobacter beijingensis TaxID=1207056 RepID=A0ABW4IBC7_9SPHI
MKFKSIIIVFLFISQGVNASKIEITDYFINIKHHSRVIDKAAEVFNEEINKRTNRTITKTVKNDFVLEIGLESEFLLEGQYLESLRLLKPTSKDGFKMIFLDNKKIIIAGNNDRGVLYGIGYLLRKIDISANKMFLNWHGNISSSPVKSIRGHEMQRNPKFNNEDESFALNQFDQYVRELALFGANTIEVLRNISPQYANICKSYGLDISIVTFDNGPDFKSEEGIAKELRMREHMMRKFPEIDHWTIKSGDPGHLDLETFFEFSQKEVELLKKIHPKAKVWLAPQRFNDAPISYFDSFIDRVNKVDWVDGLVFGPWTRTPLPELRKRISKHLPIRHFPDITHIYSSQYPVPNLDVALAITLGRICINPTPVMQKYIHNKYADDVVGSIGYSEGTNDDVNKFVWVAQDWDSSMAVEETLQDYARLFIGSAYVKEFTEGVLSLEKNLDGPLKENSNVDTSLRLWKSMELRADEKLLTNTRFAMCLLRAYYDSYVKSKLIYEDNLETQALSFLRKVEELGPEQAIQACKAELMKSKLMPVSLDLKKRSRQLFDVVYRGETGKWTMELQKCVLIDQIDVALNNEPWISQELKKIESITKNSEKISKILDIANRKERGELYYNLGSFESREIIDTYANFKEDPYYLKSAHRSFGAKLNRFVISSKDYKNNHVPKEWLTQIGIYYDQPLEMKFKKLKPHQDYIVELVYIGEMNKFNGMVKLMANDGILIHDFLNPNDYVYRFPIKKELIKNGEIKLIWQCNEGGRGTQVAEITFIKSN